MIANTIEQHPQSRPRLRSSHIQWYRICEDLTQAILFFMVIFGPWAFGSTEPWSIWIMNYLGYGIGTLLFTKLFLRRFLGYHVPRWDNPPVNSRSLPGPPEKNTTAQSVTIALVVLTFLTLGYCLLSAMNARATYLPDQARFDYHNCLGWLPHSIDRRSTWFTFCTYSALACVFWGARDWLLAKSSAEQKPGSDHSFSGSGVSPLLPAHLRRLLWLLAINGALLAGESIFQRLEDSPELLFLRKPEIHQTAITQFGPYAYRANGAQYFNLLWPVSLGFWWILNRNAGRRKKSHHLLLFFGALMAAAPIISTSRGGMLICVGMATVAALFLILSHFLLDAKSKLAAKTQAITFAGLTLFFAASLILGFFLGWKALKPRMTEINSGYEDREQAYAVARQIAEEYPFFGIGPGAYESVSELYRPQGYLHGEFWPAQVHNDWLETRITFGWIGSLLLYAALALVFVRWFLPGGIHGGRRFIFLLWLALAGCLVHARFDFPFQVHSILFLFLLISSICFVTTRRS